MVPRPNILLFFTDDQRFDTIRALGNEQVITPHLDALVARGTTFTHNFIPGGTCGAVCMPSRAMLHSGRTLFHLDREGQGIPDEHITLGECLRQAGYETYATGKWHNGTAAFARSFGAGDEIFFGGMDDHWNVPAYHYDPSCRYDHACPYTPDPFQSNALKYRRCDHVSPGKHSTDLFADSALRFLTDHDTSRPFFLYVSLMAPHDPRTMPKQYRELYNPDDIALPANFLPEHPIDTGALRIRDETLAAFPRDPAEIRRHIAEYYAMISHLDDAFGRVMAALRARGDLDNTIVVFAGDNGLALGQHGLMGKQSVYEHSVRVPLIFAGPGIAAGERRDGFSYLLDVYPTLVELAGVSVPASVEGRSLLPMLRDPQACLRDSLYLAYADSIRGLRTCTHKIIEYACGETQLFDLQADPLERENLAAQPEHAALLAELRAQLRGQADAWDDVAHPAGRAFWTRRQNDLGPKTY